MTRKRADRRRGGFLRDLERPENERSAVKKIAVPWTEAADAVLVVAISSCRSSSAYALMSVPLMEALGHSTQYGLDANPTQQTRVDDAIRAIELRVITKMLGADRGWTPSLIMKLQTSFRRMGFSMGLRHMDPTTLTWGEKAKIIRPYFARLTADKQRIDFEQLVEMLCRPKAVVSGYLYKLRGQPFVDQEEICEPPVTEQNMAELREYTKDLNYLLTDTKLTGSDLIRNRVDAIRRIYQTLRGV